MRNLPLPTINADDYFEKIAKEKYDPISARLLRMRSRVKIAYSSYSTNFKSLENVPPLGLTGVRQAALLHAYNVRTLTMQILREELLNPSVEWFDECPYCGISEPKTLDHYLPKEDYPEFAILPANLIPICHVCNTTYKGKKIFSNTGMRLFLHSYADEIPNATFIKISIDIKNTINLDFSFLPNANYLAFSSIFANHFNELGLRTRFFKKSAAEIARKRSSLARFYQQGYEKVSRELQTEADDLRASLSCNHWKVALYYALAQSKEFCDGGFAKQIAPFKKSRNIKV